MKPEKGRDRALTTPSHTEEHTGSRKLFDHAMTVERLHKHEVQRVHCTARALHSPCTTQPVHYTARAMHTLMIATTSLSVCFCP